MVRHSYDYQAYSPGDYGGIMGAAVVDYLSKSAPDSMKWSSAIADPTAFAKKIDCVKKTAISENLSGRRIVMQDDGVGVAVYNLPPETHVGIVIGSSDSLYQNILDEWVNVLQRYSTAKLFDQDLRQGRAVARFGPARRGGPRPPGRGPARHASGGPGWRRGPARPARGGPPPRGPPKRHVLNSCHFRT